MLSLRIRRSLPTSNAACSAGDSIRPPGIDYRQIQTEYDNSLKILIAIVQCVRLAFTFVAAAYDLNCIRNPRQSNDILPIKRTMPRDNLTNFVFT
jgi:hypothetical protein